MEDEIRGARSELSGRRPDHLIAGVMRDPRETQLAVNELNVQGFTEDSIFVLHGQRGAESLRHRGEAAGFLRWVWGRFVEFAAARDDFVRRHIEAAEQGNYVIGVELTRAESRGRDGVHSILKSHGAHDVIRVGRGFSEEILGASPRLIVR